jgi:hypothetical protein
VTARREIFLDPLARLRRNRRGFRGNREHREILFDAIERDPMLWNKWRRDHPRVVPDLRHVDLRGLELHEMDFRSARLFEANLSECRMWSAIFTEADLRHANLQKTELNYAHLEGAHLDYARLVQSNLTMVSAEGAHFRHADLSYADLGGARLCGADLTEAHVSGVNAWNVEVDEYTRQTDMLIDVWVDPLLDLGDVDNSAIEQIAVRTDHIEAAQLLHLLSSRSKMRTVIQALTGRVVLLLGNFGRNRKSILLQVRVKLAELGYAPILFDFPRPDERDLIETVSLVAGMSRFVIADLTRPHSTPLEAMLIAPNVMIPFAPIIRYGETPFAMFGALQAKYDWILETWSYRDAEHLMRTLKRNVIDPCEQMSRKLVRRQRRADPPPATPARSRRRQPAGRARTSSLSPPGR